MSDDQCQMTKEIPEFGEAAIVGMRPSASATLEFPNRVWTTALAAAGDGRTPGECQYSPRSDIRLSDSLTRANCSGVAGREGNVIRRVALDRQAQTQRQARDRRALAEGYRPVDSDSRSNSRRAQCEPAVERALRAANKSIVPAHAYRQPEAGRNSRARVAVGAALEHPVRMMANPRPAARLLCSGPAAGRTLFDLDFARLRIVIVFPGEPTVEYCTADAPA